MNSESDVTLDPREPDLAEPELAARLRLVLNRLARRLRSQTPEDLSPSLTSALVTIELHGPITLGKLAACERVTPPSITRMVASLEQRGLVRGEADAGDRRVTRVSLTAEGRRSVVRTRTRKTAYLAKRLRKLRRRGARRAARGAAGVRSASSRTSDERRRAAPRSPEGRPREPRPQEPGTGFPDAHVPLPAYPQLSPLVRRPDGLAMRYVDAIGGPVLAGPGAHPQRLRSRRHGGSAVRPGARLRHPRRPGRRPFRQAQGATRHADGLHRSGHRALGARGQRRGAPLDDLGAGHRLRLHQCPRQPCAPELRHGDGRLERPGQRGKPEQCHRQHVAHHRPGCCRRADRHGRPLMGFPGQRGLLRGGDRRPVRDARRRAASQASGGARQRPDRGPGCTMHGTPGSSACRWS